MSQTKKMWIWWMGCILGILSGMNLASASSPNPEIAWLEDVDQAMQMAKTHNKPLLLHFYGNHCPPCRMLEAKAFRDRNLVASINDNVIAVKINADEHRDIAQLYSVNRWPTDVYLYPDGSVMERGVCNQDPQAYARTVLRVSQRHRDWTLTRVAEREAKEKREQHVSTRSYNSFKSRIFGDTQRRSTPVKVSAAAWKLDLPADVASLEQPAPPAIDVAKELDASAPPSHDDAESPLPNVVRQPPSSVEDPHAKQIQDLATQPALGGYCPVTLQDYLKMDPQAQSGGSAWVSGKDCFSVRHRGRIYRCVSEETRQRFLKDPDTYAPMLSGCDVVAFARTGALVNGLCEFGFIEQNTGRVFLFASQANYEEFARRCGQQPTSTEPRVADDKTTMEVR